MIAQMVVNQQVWVSVKLWETIGMHEHLKFTWGIFWRWFIVNFTLGFFGAMISRELMRKAWIQIPVAMLTLWLALIWLLRTKRTDGRNQVANWNSLSYAEASSPFALRFTWEIFWRWYLVEFIFQNAFALFFPKDSYSIMWVQQIVPFPALIATLFWVLKARLRIDKSSTSH